MKKIRTQVPAICCLALTLIIACNKSPQNQNAQTADTNGEKPQLATEEKQLTQEELIRNGEHLVAVAGCDDCHSPKKYEKGMPMPDMEKRLSGHQANEKLGAYDPATVKNGWAMTNSHFTAWVGPWGTSFSSNLTPDTATGLGSWTEENFFKAMREGKYGGTDKGRPILPPMPWPNFKNYTDAELKAIFAYLKSVKPIKNVVPAPTPPKGA
jgi:cytochrome c553